MRNNICHIYFMLLGAFKSHIWKYNIQKRYLQHIHMKHRNILILFATSTRNICNICLKHQKQRNHMFATCRKSGYTNIVRWSNTWKRWKDKKDGDSQWAWRDAGEWSLMPRLEQPYHHHIRTEGKRPPSRGVSSSSSRRRSSIHVTECHQDPHYWCPEELPLSRID
jgi:hypothetical protein